VLEWLENTQFSTWVRGDFWGWPLVLTIHALGTALVIGFIFIISLRLLGLFGLLPYSSLHRLFPVIWVALAIQLLSGFVLWMTKPTQYVADGAFMLKFALVVAGGILTLFLYRTIMREAASWEAKGTTSPRGVTFVAATLLVWSSVLVASRLIAHLGSI
jgi:hypothetical protein